jgi:uncharacterized protein YdcH (DUF465 family)
MAKKFPKTIGACVDLAYTIRGKRIDLQKTYDAEISEMKDEEAQLEDYIINTFKKAEIDGAKGSVASASISTAIYPKVNDWTAVWEYIVETKSYDLMERRMGKLAFRARFEEGVAIPGTEAFTKMELSLTKVSK